jgi:hydrogenase maturation factor HypF (carbamoyltransferase family)
MLLEKRRRLDKMISTIEKTIQHSKGEIKMTNKEKFEGFDFDHNPYEKEARELWGDKAVVESNEKIAKLSELEKKEFVDKFNAIYKNLASLRHLPADSAEVQAAIKEWYIFLNEIGNYSLEAFKNLGQMYVDDVRFTESIDKFGEGLAKLMCDAMAVYADTNK